MMGAKHVLTGLLEGSPPCRQLAEVVNQPINQNRSM